MLVPDCQQTLAGWGDHSILIVEHVIFQMCKCFLALLVAEKSVKNTCTGIFLMLIFEAFVNCLKGLIKWSFQGVDEYVIHTRTECSSTLRQRNLKQSFISMDGPAIHTNFSQKWSFFEKVHQTRGIENAGFVLVWTNQAFLKTMSR